MSVSHHPNLPLYYSHMATFSPSFLYQESIQQMGLARKQGLFQKGEA